MTLIDFLTAITGIAGLLFVMTSMLAMSLSLSIQQMIQPLKNARLVVLSLLLFIVGSRVIGFAVGGRDPGIRNVMGLGTAQPNVSAAILLPLILISTARWLGGRSEAAAAPVTQAK
jgi:hypothetical protein